jgi:hypothetical protein
VTAGGGVGRNRPPGDGPHPQHDESLAVALARLTGCMEAGFRDTHGRLDVITERVQHTREGVDDLETRVRSLEERRWPVGSVATLSGFVAAMVAAIPLVVR